MVEIPDWPSQLNFRSCTRRTSFLFTNIILSQNHIPKYHIEFKTCAAWPFLACQCFSNFCLSNFTEVLWCAQGRLIGSGVRTDQPHLQGPPREKVAHWQEKRSFNKGEGVEVGLERNKGRKIPCTLMKTENLSRPPLILANKTKLSL